MARRIETEAPPATDVAELERRFRRLRMRACDPPEFMDACNATIRIFLEALPPNLGLAERVAALEEFLAEKRAEGWKAEQAAAEAARRPDGYERPDGGIVPWSRAGGQR